MSRISKYLLISIALLIPELAPIWSNAWADVPMEQRREIEHMLGFIEKSKCTLIRNGVSYKNIAAAGHVRKKYEHFKNDITNSEDFILLSATKSTLSGSFYQVSCPGQEIRLSRDWLLDELNKFRIRQ